MNPILYRLFLWKSYIMQGYSLTQFVKYFIMAFGLWEATGARDLNKLIFIAIAYIIFCFILGWIWFKFKFINIELEISNQYNPLAKQLRQKFNIPKNIKRIKS